MGKEVVVSYNNSKASSTIVVVAAASWLVARRRSAARPKRERSVAEKKRRRVFESRVTMSPGPGRLFKNVVARAGGGPVQQPLFFLRQWPRRRAGVATSGPSLLPTDEEDLHSHMHQPLATYRPRHCFDYAKASAELQPCSNNPNSTAIIMTPTAVVAVVVRVWYLLHRSEVLVAATAGCRRRLKFL